MEQGLRQLTEAEAWETLARYFRGWDGQYPKTLPPAIVRLRDDLGLLAPLTSSRVFNSLWKRLPLHVIWPLTREGALQRAAFAEREMLRARGEGR